MKIYSVINMDVGNGIRTEHPYTRLFKYERKAKEVFLGYVKDSISETEETIFEIDGTKEDKDKLLQLISENKVDEAYDLFEQVFSYDFEYPVLDEVEVET